MLAMLVATGFAFAITEAQKTAFAKKVTEEVIPAIKANDELGAAKIGWNEMLTKVYTDTKIDATAKPVAEWAVSAPAEYLAFTKENGGMYANAIARYYIDTHSLLDWQTCTAAQSGAVYDHRKQYDDAMASKSVYASLKASKFISGGLPMSEHKVLSLMKKYGDLEAYEAKMAKNTDAETKEALAKDFTRYFEILTTWAANENLDAKVRWKKFEGIEIGFMKYKVAKNADGTNKYPQLVDAWSDVQTAHQTYRTFYEWNK